MMIVYQFYDYAPSNEGVEQLGYENAGRKLISTQSLQSVATRAVSSRACLSPYASAARPPRPEPGERACGEVPRSDTTRASLRAAGAYAAG